MSYGSTAKDILLQIAVAKVSDGKQLYALLLEEVLKFGGGVIAHITAHVTAEKRILLLRTD